VDPSKSREISAIIQEIPNGDTTLSAIEFYLHPPTSPIGMKPDRTARQCPGLYRQKRRPTPNGEVFLSLLPVLFCVWMTPFFCSVKNDGILCLTEK
jgi:hypothetical protein